MEISITVEGFGLTREDPRNHHNNPSSSRGETPRIVDFGANRILSAGPRPYRSIITSFSRISPSSPVSSISTVSRMGLTNSVI